MQETLLEYVTMWRHSDYFDCSIIGSKREQRLTSLLPLGRIQDSEFIMMCYRKLLKTINTWKYVFVS